MVHFPSPGIPHQKEIKLKMVIQPEGGQLFSYFSKDHAQIQCSLCQEKQRTTKKPQTLACFNNINDGFFYRGHFSV